MVVINGGCFEVNDVLHHDQGCHQGPLLKGYNCPSLRATQRFSVLQLKIDKNSAKIAFSL